ncbi:Plant UBX domain-containing protein 4, partial [Coemansia spiralis]
MSDSAEQDKLVRQWLDVNPGDEDQARFYLEANNWDLSAALSNFYENPPLSEGLAPSLGREDAVLPPDPLLAAAGPGVHAPTTGPVTSGWPAESPAAAAAAPVPRQRHGSGARIATLSSLSGSGENSAGDDGPPEWYTGGERSGMAVQAPDPLGDNDNGRSLVDRIMRRAAEDMASHGRAPRGEDAPQSTFAGRGRTINSSASDQQGELTDDDDSSD